MKTLKGVEQSARIDPCRVGRCNRLVPWASRKAAHPRLLTFILSGWFGCGLSRAASLRWSWCDSYHFVDRLCAGLDARYPRINTSRTKTTAETQRTQGRRED